jgi:PAS domain S-box-containing protein
LWERTFNAVPDLITILDNRFRIVQVNKAMADRLGATRESFKGKPCYTLFHGTQTPPAQSPHSLSLKDNQEHTLESYERQLNGFFIISTSPIFDPEGKMIGSVHVARDITKRKEAEDEKERLIRELQQALQNIKVLSGLLPICAECKKIRNDQGYWEQIENYIRDHSEATFSHGLCPDCLKSLYPEINKKLTEQRKSEAKTSGSEANRSEKRSE